MSDEVFPLCFRGELRGVTPHVVGFLMRSVEYVLDVVADGGSAFLVVAVVAVEHCHTVFDGAFAVKHFVDPLSESAEVGGDAGCLESYALKGGIAPRFVV